MTDRLRRWSLLTRLSIAAAGIALAGLIFAWSGLFNVGASRGHFAVVELALSFIMHNSVGTHARGAPAPPPLDNPDLEILGASHFHRNCAPCHSAPGQRLDAMAQTMLPPPPELTDASERWKDRELFWIVRRGIKLPACGPGRRIIAMTRCGRWSHPEGAAGRSIREDMHSPPSAPIPSRH